MNKLSKYIAFALIGFVAASCVTGNDDSEVLREHEEALEKTPRVLNLTVNGETMQRDSLSHWIPVIVKAGDVLEIKAELNTGIGATSSELQFSRYYYHSFTPYGLETGVDSDYELIDTQENGSGVTEISYSFTVPATDDDGFDFWPHDHINLAFWTTNNTGGVGYNDFTLEFAE